MSDPRKIQELWKKIEDASLPQLSTDQQSSATVIAFGPEDLLQQSSTTPVVSQPDTEVAMRARAAFCKGMPWWNCTSEDTQGTCRFLSGKCEASPIMPEKESYVVKWRRIHDPIYGPMEMPDIDLNTGELNVVKRDIRPRRRRSITRTYMRQTEV